MPVYLFQVQFYKYMHTLRTSDDVLLMPTPHPHQEVILKAILMLHIHFLHRGQFFLF